MKKTFCLFALSIILIFTLLLSCGGGGGGVDNAMEDTSFSIGYNSNGAESGTAPAAQQGNGKEVLSVSANSGNLAKGGYLFDGWNTSADGSGADYAPGALYNGKNITLYAKWAAIFTYSINAVSPAPSLDGVQQSPGISSAVITGLTERGRQLSSVSIPSSIDGYTISSIGASAFQDCSNLTEITIPNTVTDIGDNAFNGCANLSELTMQGTAPPSLGADAFTGCVLLVVSVPQSAASTYNEKPGWTTVTIISPGIFSINYSGNGSDGGVVPLRQMGTTGFPVQVYGNTGDLTRAGCTFNNWNTKPDGTGNRFVPNDSYSGPDNIVLYAQWTHPDYTVTFNGNEADTEASPGSITVKAPANTMGELPSTPPKKNGYYFAGWYTQSGGTDDPFVVGSQVIDSMTVYAKWTLRPDFTVTYEAPEATTPAGQTSKVVVAPKTTVEELPTAPKRTGYNFGGWYTEKDGKGTRFTAETTVNDNITVYAKWESYNYSVTFASPGADTAANPTSMSVKSPATTVEALPSDPVKDGNVFDGWYTEPNGNGDLFTASTLVDGDITVYANWSTLYSITYVGNNNTGGQAPERQRGENGDIITLQSQGNLERIGYTFNGWNTNADGSGTDYSAGANHTISGNLVLYAKWTANVYQITYKDKGGSAFSGVHGDNHPTSHTYGRSTALVNPTKVGYLFGGWYSNSACTGDALIQINTDAITENITLYAKWNEYHYTVTFNSQGATTGASPTRIDVDSPNTTVGSLPSEPIKTGYRFGGWNTKADGTGTDYLEEASYRVNGNATLYAKWLRLYTIIYDSNGATGGFAPSAQEYVGISGETITLCANTGNLTRSGYWFGGWNTKADGSGINRVEGASYTITGDVTMYAKWFNPYVEKENLEVGDIVLQNGKYVSYANFSTYSSQYMAVSRPAGVVAYIGITGTAGTTGKVYMLGLSVVNRQWAPYETTGYTTKFSTSGKAGEGNWAVIQTADPEGTADASTNYPAFEYANTYSITGFTSGWFLPSEGELNIMYTNMQTINSSISAIISAGGSATQIWFNTNSPYWSSTQYSGANNKAYCAQRKKQYDSFGDDKKTYYSIRVVRALDD
ncbi:MAG: InlB B-repeat-containing protein [Spirochaetia bacterium]|nr:InlB B-repeat-containing protein [Spirochaetia bacterium]